MTPVVPSDESRLGAALLRFFAACLFILIVLFVSHVAWCYYVMESLPVAQQKMDRIQPGLSMNNVRAILGEPDRVWSSNDGKPYQWTYCPSFHWQMFQVYFDNEGQVRESVLDR
jgi:SmpA/OmlA family protein